MSQPPGTWREAKCHGAHGELPSRTRWPYSALCRDRRPKGRVLGGRSQRKASRGHTSNLRLRGQQRPCSTSEENSSWAGLSPVTLSCSGRNVHSIRTPLLLGGKGDPGAWCTKGPNTPRFFQIPCCSKFSGPAAPEREGCGPRGHHTSQENLWLQARSEAPFTPCPRVNRQRHMGFQEQRSSLPDAGTQGLSVSILQHRLRTGTHLLLDSSPWPSSPNEEKGAVSHLHGIPS